MTNAMRGAVGGLISLSLGLCLLFWLIPAWVESDQDLRLPVSLVPQIVAIGLILAGLGMIVRGGIAVGRGDAVRTDAFDDGEFGMFCLMIVILLAATIGFEVLHFLIVAPLLVAVSMWVFGRLRPVSLVLTATMGPLVIWVLGTEVLGRVLP